MFKPKYDYDHDRLEYVKARSAARNFARLVLLFFLPAFLSGGLVCFFVLTFITDTPHSRVLRQQIEQQGIAIDAMKKQANTNLLMLKNLQDRDDNLYRVVYEADPIPTNVRNADYTPDETYEKLRSMPDNKKIVALQKDVNLIQHQIFIQMKSYEELWNYAKNKDDILATRPAIQPILNTDLKRTASGWGWRMHPILHILKFHYGMDFAAPMGTPVYATGNGVVTQASFERGFGNCVVVDHGYEYKSLYGHLSAFGVKVGDKVKRGDVIAYVGSTGTSTGPHLHYEVHYKDQAVDPRNYYFMDLSPQLYDEMITISSNNGKSFD